jgi:hypothetical protein
MAGEMRGPVWTARHAGAGRTAGLKPLSIENRSSTLRKPGDISKADYT